MRKFSLVLFACLLTLPGLASAANASTPTLSQLARELSTLQAKVKAQGARIADQGKRIATLRSKLASDEAVIAGQGNQLASAAPVLAIAPYVSLNTSTMNGVAGPNIVFQGCNVHVRSATAEDDISGLGNLIIGWDDDPDSTPDFYRSGSNNLVCGAHNSFSGYGGFVAGAANKIDTGFASVSGGGFNTANRDGASVSGGEGNTANLWYASVSGGYHNQAAAGPTLLEGSAAA